MIFVESELEEERPNHRILHSTNLKSPWKTFLYAYVYSHNPLGDVSVTSLLAINNGYKRVYYVGFCDIAEEKEFWHYYMVF